MSTPSQEKDELDAPSGVFIEHEVVSSVDGSIMKITVEQTFRELQATCAADIELWDSLNRDMRAHNQVANDPDWRPIRPYAGARKYKRWRGR
jgi:hypothetical protein